MATNNSSSSSSGGIGFVGMLTILFIGLKLTNNIDWSWWWVISPIWISVSLFISFVVISLIVMVIVEARKDRKSRQSRKEWDRAA
jgi:predicted tellurium resistance membrane protein TerC